jgi:serine/threonine-protein kinase
MLLAYLKVCEAVAFAHSRGVLHCDLKPDNVMVGPFGQVYVVDWGLAIVKQSGAEAGAAPGVRSGTPSFMSPEHVLGLPLTEATDVFGLGAILYSILTGATPYDADDGIKAMAQARACVIDIPAFDAGRPLLGDLGRIVRKAMAREPADRYPDVSALRAAVELALRGPPVTARLFAPGARIVVEGERGDCAFVIVRGACVAYKTVDGQRVLLNRLDAGAVFGETAVLSGGLRTATVEAETEVLVKIVSAQLLQQHVGHETPFGTVVLAQADRFRELDRDRER